MTKITVKFITLGCKTNIYESEAMAELFKRSGYEVIPDTDPINADVCVINTCTVTGTGAKKSRQQIRRAKRQNPSAVIAVTGCFAQTEPDAVREIGADVIIGNEGRARIVELVERAREGDKTSVVRDILHTHGYEELTRTSTQSRIRANIKIEDGCDNFCAYCIIPYARGPVRSRALDKIIAEAAELSENGYREIVLTGIHIGSYGKDLESGETLIDVIEALDKLDKIERIRLGSIEPVVITPAFVRRAAALTKLCPQFHLSLQSGCSATLKRMGRHYTADEYKAAVDMLKRSIPDVSITTDLMVGFPGETDEEFRESLELCRYVGFMKMHVFKYSIRKGTRAEKMPQQADEHTKELRSREAIELSEDMKREFCERYIGRPVSVLLETKRDDGLYHGMTPNYIDVLVRHPSANPSETVTVIPKEYKNGFLYAEDIIL